MTGHRAATILLVSGLVWLSGGALHARPLPARSPLAGGAPPVDPQPRLAAAADASCEPPCRTGYFCRNKQCISLCNPPCSINERCTGEAECEPLAAKPAAARLQHYVGVVGGYRAAVNGSAMATADIRLELGSRYTSFQIGPGFGEDVTILRSALLVHIPLRPSPRWPLFLEPTMALGYAYAFIDDAVETAQQDIFITPGMRVRYDPVPRLSLLLDLVQVEIAFLRLQSSKVRGVHRVPTVPVNWTFSAGAAFRY